MSVFSDAFKLLNSETNAFALLPAINHGYVYWKTNNPSVNQDLVVLFSIVVSAVAFNFLTHGEFESYNSGDDTIGLGTALLIILIAVVWLGSLVCSLIGLYSLLPSEKPWALLLAAVSILFLTLAFSHVLLSRYVPVYASS